MSDPEVEVLTDTIERIFASDLDTQDAYLSIKAVLEEWDCDADLFFALLAERLFSKFR